MWQIFGQTWKPLVLLGFWGVKKVTKFVPCDKKWDKPVTKCQNMHFMHKKCIKIQQMWQTGDKICHNMGEMWQTGDKNWKNFVITHIRCDKLGQILSLQKYQFCKNIANTLMYQTIVTNFVTLGTKMWQNLNPHKPRGCAVSSMCQKFCHISIQFVTCLSPFCHAPKPRHINVSEGF